MIEMFNDGNMAEVVRMGDIVRKQRGPWWNATRQVLNHLEHVGYPWSPRILGESDDSVDLSFMAGKSILPHLENADKPELLKVIGARVREMHDALESFRFASGTECVPWTSQMDNGTIICHNDLSPWNTILENGGFRGFIDWDLVSYGSREWELAWICWRWAPIYPHGNRTHFPVEDQVERCRVLLEAYGLDALNLRHFADAIDERMENAIEIVERLGAEGISGFDRLLATGMHLSGHDDRAWLAAHRSQFQAGLESIQR